MSITTNEGGVLRELTEITTNEGGVLHELDTVHANEGGVLNEIFSANTLPTELTWVVRSVSSDVTDSSASLVSHSGLSVVFKGASATAVAIECYPIRLRAGTIIRHKYTATTQFTYTSLIANLWVCKVGNTLNGTNMFPSNSYTVPEDGSYYLGLGGMAWNGPTSTANWATFTSTISFS